MNALKHFIRREGKWVSVTAEEYLSRRSQAKADAAHRSGLSTLSSQLSTRATGLGDLVARVATPLARALKLPCIDPQTGQLRPESGCAQRKAALNDLTAKIAKSTKT